jgi:hypothetical protein
MTLQSKKEDKEKRGQAPFLKEFGIRPYPKEAREGKVKKVAFLDNRARHRRDSPFQFLC